MKIDKLSTWFKNHLEKKYHLAQYFKEPLNRDSNDSNTSIIDEPHVKLKFEIIDFDLSKNVKIINNVLLIHPDTSSVKKAVCYIVKGVGGGKTRSLEELKMALNSDTKTLCVAITYNVNWPLDNYFPSFMQRLYPHDLAFRDESIEIDLIFSLITRITSIVYGTIHSRVISEYVHTITTMPEIQLESRHLILVSFLKAIIDDIRERGTRDVKNFVLMVDETKKIHDILSKLYSDYSHDHMSIIRSVVLGQELSLYAKVNSALVLSSLSPDTLNLSKESGRVFIPIELPTSLRSSSIVEKWWIPQLIDSVKNGLTSQHLAFLRLLAAMCSQSPRAAEICGGILSTKLNNNSKMDLDFFNEILQELKEAIALRYTLTLPNANNIHALIFRRHIHTNELFTELVRSGIFSNSLNAKSSAEVPTSSVVLLAQAATKYVEETGQPYAYAESIIDIYRSCLSQSVHPDPGKLFESVMIEIFKMKLNCDMLCPDVSTKLLGLLVVPKELKEQTSIAPLLHTFLPKSPSGTTLVVELPSYYDDSKKFYEVLANPSNVPTKQFPYRLFKPSKNTKKPNSHDLMLAVYNGQNRPPIILFIEFKSSQKILELSESSTNAISESKSKKIFKDFPGDGAQYIKTKKQILTNKVSNDKSIDGILKTLRNNHTELWTWSYIYMAKHPKFTQSRSIDNCILLGKNEVEKFLGPFKELYDVAGATLELKDTTVSETNLPIVENKE